jgi:hypothetical protein
VELSDGSAFENPYMMPAGEGAGLAAGRGSGGPKAVTVRSLVKWTGSVGIRGLDFRPLRAYLCKRDHGLDTGVLSLRELYGICGKKKVVQVRLSSVFPLAQPSASE